MSKFKPQELVWDNAWQNETGQRGEKGDLGWLAAEFEAFAPDTKYGDKWRAAPSKDAWDIIEPRTAPPVGHLMPIVERLIKSTWKFAEPARDTPRGDLLIGTRGMPNAMAQAVSNQTYHPQVRPTRANIDSSFPTDTAIASDWEVFHQIERTNAVTFRGDTRTPSEIISRAGGFHPPMSRTDRYYLENGIYYAFKDYLNRRFGRSLESQDFLRAVDSSAPSPEQKSLLIDYLMWRKITEREAVHLGRMVENECLKGYISTARSIDTAISFGTAYNKKPGWLYVTVVHAGFIVPWNERENFWGSREAEIAQWGSIPSERIVGFRHLDGWAPEGPVFIRRKFRKSEPDAFRKIFNIMCGATKANLS